ISSHLSDMADLTTEFIDNWRKQASDITDDDGMRTVLSRSFDVLKNLCKEDWDASSLEYQLESMVVERGIAMKYDNKRNAHLRDFFYGLSESIQKTAPNCSLADRKEAQLLKSLKKEYTKARMKLKTSR
ncbi:hypothetical protein PFISCL1PPCAC_29053, partial [Pristionchus fissidentatus]